jgi:hypothetical protein
MVYPNRRDNSCHPYNFSNYLAISAKSGPIERYTFVNLGYVNK